MFFPEPFQADPFLPALPPLLTACLPSSRGRIHRTRQRRSAPPAWPQCTISWKLIAWSQSLIMFESKHQTFSFSNSFHKQKLSGYRFWTSSLLFVIYYLVKFSFLRFCPPHFCYWIWVVHFFMCHAFQFNSHQSLLPPPAANKKMYMREFEKRVDDFRNRLY